MRIAHLGDLHLTEGPRFESTLKCLRYVVEDGVEHGVQLWLVGGDLSGTTVPHKATPAERNALAEIFIAMAAIAPVVICEGNHEAPEDLSIYGKLRAPHPIAAITRPLALTVAGCRMYVLPYPSKRHFVAAAGAGALEQQKVKVEGGLQAILSEWRADRREHADLPAVLLAHINIGGCHVAGGEVLIGQEIELAPRDLDELGIGYAALSHIHLHQQVSQVGWYAGSPDRSNFGETDEKGYVIADVTAAGGLTVTRRLTPAQRLVTIRAEWGVDGDVTGWIGDDVPRAAEISGAEVRVLVQVAEEYRAGAEAAIQRLAEDLTRDGAASVKVERRILPRTRVRFAAIQTARTAAEKIEAYWESLGDNAPDDAQRGRVLGKLAELHTTESAAEIAA